MQFLSRYDKSDGYAIKISICRRFFMTVFVVVDHTTDGVRDSLWYRRFKFLDVTPVNYTGELQNTVWSFRATRKIECYASK